MAPVPESSFALIPVCQGWGLGVDPVWFAVPRVENITDLHVFSFALVIHVFKEQGLHILSR